METIVSVKHLLIYGSYGSFHNQTYQEILESMPFTPASRTTEADLKNDRKSLERRLQDSLYLVVKRSRNQHEWQFPQGKWIDGETMRAVS